MKHKKWTLLLGIIFALLISTSCNEWGLADDPAGTNNLPKPDPKPDDPDDPEIPDDPKPAATLLAHFNFENNLLASTVGSVTGTLKSAGTGALPTFETDAERGGTILKHIQGAAGNESYVEFINPLKGNEVSSFSVSLWIKHLPDYWIWDAIWTFYEGDTDLDGNGTSGRMFFNPNTFFGYNGNEGWFDMNNSQTVTSAIPHDTWTMVTTILEPSGVKVYINGELKYAPGSYAAWACSSGGEEANHPLYQKAIEFAAGAPTFNLGFGAFWGTPAMLLDDISIYNGTLTDAEVMELYVGIDTKSGLVADFDFENNSLTSSVGSIMGTLKSAGTGTLPTFETDAERGGTVLKHSQGAAGNESYTEFINPLKGTNASAFSVSLWMKHLPEYWIWDAIWTFYEGDADLDGNGTFGRIFFNPNTFFGYNGAGGWFDINNSQTVTGAIPRDTWTMVTATLEPSGVKVYINGELKYAPGSYAAWANGSGGEEANHPLYQTAIDFAVNAPTFNLGFGAFWGTPAMLVDNVKIYSKALSSEQVAAIYNETK